MNISIFQCSVRPVAQRQEGTPVKECPQNHCLCGWWLLFQWAEVRLRGDQRQEELGDHHGRITFTHTRGIPGRNEGTGWPWGIKSSSSFWMNIWLARFCHGWAATRSKIASFQDFFPHHTRRKSFLPKYWQTLSQILAYMQLLDVFPLHPNLKMFQLLQLLKSRVCFPIKR